MLEDIGITPGSAQRGSHVAPWIKDGTSGMHSRSLSYLPGSLNLEEMIGLKDRQRLMGNEMKKQIKVEIQSFIIQPFINSSIHSSIHFSIYSSTIQPFIHSFFHPPIHPFTPPFIHPHIYPFTPPSIIHPFIHLLLHPSISSSIYLPNNHLECQAILHGGDIME